MTYNAIGADTMSAIGGVGRMGMGLVRGGMGMVGGAARYAAAAALANPLGALAVGGTIAGTAVLAAGTAGVVATGERALGDLRAGHEMQNILTVRGSSVEAARDISRQLLQTGRTAGNFTGVETEAMFEMGLQGGLFSRQMGDPQQLVGRLGKVARSAKELMRTLNLGMREAMQQIVEMNQMGVEVEDVTATTMQGSAFARAAGVSQGAMSRAGAMGARMATSMGMRGFAGAGVAQSAMVTSSVAATEMNSALMRAAGGVEGSAQAIAARTIAFGQSGFGQALIMGNMGMPGGPGLSMRGGIAGSVLRAAEAASQGGMMGGVKAMFAMQDARSRMDDVDLENLSRGAIMGIANQIGIDPKDEESMAAISAQVMGFDLGTAEGAQQARIFAKGFDPRVQMRKTAELREQRRRVLNRSGLASVQGDAMFRNLREATWGKWGRNIGEKILGAEAMTQGGLERMRLRYVAPFLGKGTVLGTTLAGVSGAMGAMGIETGRGFLDDISMLGARGLSVTTSTATADIERRALEAIASTRGDEATAKDVLDEQVSGKNFGLPEKIAKEMQRGRFMRGLFEGGEKMLSMFQA
jgi:hypothetical protein